MSKAPRPPLRWRWTPPEKRQLFCGGFGAICETCSKWKRCALAKTIAWLIILHYVGVEKIGMILVVEQPTTNYCRNHRDNEVKANRVQVLFSFSRPPQDTDPSLQKGLTIEHRPLPATPEARRRRESLTADLIEQCFDKRAFFGKDLLGLNLRCFRFCVLSVSGCRQSGRMHRQRGSGERIFPNA